VTEPAATSPRSPLVRLGDWLFRWRNYVFPVTFVAVLLVDRPRLAGGSPAWDRWMDVLGIAVAAAGQGVRALVIGLAYVRRGGKDGKVHADTLVQEGVFAHSRNPLYFGNLLVFLGLTIALNSPAAWLLGMPAVLLAYSAIVAAEERFLRGRFGAEYEAYCARVPRYVPSLTGLGDTLRGTPFDWRRVIRKDYGTAFSWMTAVLLVLVRERAANGMDLRRSWPLYAAVWLLVVAGWAAARFLKKSGRLRLG